MPNKTVTHQAISVIVAQGPTAFTGPDWTQDHSVAYETAVADPGNAGAIPVTLSGFVKLTTAGAETRTLAIPTFVGQGLILFADTLAGNCVITASQRVNAAGNKTITFTAAGQVLYLEAVTIAAALRWSVQGNDAVTLAA